jgi:uncharacterized protein (TIGR02996 family)
MTDDEAFIRAVVDSPGDDTPRLVYADWLDDRTDPRGQYLRAEAKWAKPWRIGKRPTNSRKMQDRAAGLDPVWVARVSRPPLGVCCDHVRFTGSGPRLTRDALAAAEQHLGVTFPDPYRAFLLNYNGGKPDPFEFQLKRQESFERVYDFGAVTTRGTKDDTVVNLSQQIWALGGPAAAGSAVYVAWDPFCGSHSARRYLLCTAGDRAGRILAWEDWSPDQPATYTENLPGWLAALRHHSPDWVRFIYRGDRERFRAWLDAGGSVDARDGNAMGIGRSPLDFAAEYDQPDIARDLFARGARTDQAFWVQVAGGHPLAEWMRNLEQSV